MSQMHPLPTPVLAVFQTLEQTDRETLLAVRELIFDVAAQDPRIGPIDEALRWGEPAYLTTQGKTGSTIRLGIEKLSGKPAIFFNCKTTLVEEFRQKFGSELAFSKNRAILIEGDVVKLSTLLKSCIASALCYHTRK